MDPGDPTGTPFDTLHSDLDTFAAQTQQQVSTLAERLATAEQRIASEAQTQQPWWRQKVWGIQSGWIVGGIAFVALLALWRSGKRS